MLFIDIVVELLKCSAWSKVFIEPSTKLLGLFTVPIILTLKYLIDKLAGLSLLRDP